MMKRSPLKRSTPLRSNTPIKKVSAKRSKVAPVRRSFVKEMLALRPLCEAQIPYVCRQISVDVHEILTRARGGSITDPDNVLTLCRMCHIFITDNPAFAMEHGFVVSQWSGLDEMESARRARGQYLYGNFCGEEI